MKATKRLFTGFLALVMMLCLSMTAFATGGDGQGTTYSDEATVTITKRYVETNEGTTSPEETFTLRQISSDVTDGEAETAPDLGTITGAYFAEGAAEIGPEGAVANITIELPEYTRVGVYEYTLQEVAGNTAGVTYYGSTIRLVVTVIQGTDGRIRVAAVHTEADGETKSDIFENTYSAGTLNITKTVSGNLGDKEKYFAFEVTLTGESGKTYADAYAVTGGSYAGNPDKISVDGATITVYLKDGETITIANLPYNVSYSVTEVGAGTETEPNGEGYTTTVTGNTGTINAAAQTAAFTNTKTGEVDTGITLDSMPYVLVLACVAIAGVGMIARKRRIHD